MWLLMTQIAPALVIISYLKLKIVFEQIHVKYNDPLKLYFKEADQYVPKSLFVLSRVQQRWVGNKMDLIQIADMNFLNSKHNYSH